MNTDPLINWMSDFNTDVAALAGIFMQFSAAFMAGLDPTTHRRMARDLARLNRRPSLIHNGRKPR